MQVLVLAGLAATTPAGATDAMSSGRGWSVVRLDVDVRLAPGRGTFSTEGVIRIELTGLEKSYGPLLLVGTQRTADDRPAMAFRHLEAVGATTEILEQPLEGRWQQAFVRFREPLPRGTTVDVRFRCRMQGTVRRMIVHETAAMADWINGWLPFPLAATDGAPELVPATFRAPGRTTLYLPAGWKGLVDGVLGERRVEPDGAVEVWQTPEGLARGFVAGPYEIVASRVGGREIRVYVLDAAKSAEAQRLAERLGQAIAAEEARLGPWPISDGYSIVEFPRLPQQSFGAVSEQTHIIVQPPNLDYAGGNIQLLAHEAAHAWWGNRIGTTGPGSLWCSESLAQFGALIAIEALEGAAAFREFLDFGRLGTDPAYSAAGYFAILRQGHDRPLATMGEGEGTHALANSKGVWVLRMLGATLGEERFYGVLRDVIRDFDGRELSATDLRQRFVRAAPQRNLETFFAQWLDRAGAPVLDADWYATVDGSAIHIELAQVQDGEPFTLDLELAIDLADGSSMLERLTIGERRQRLDIPTPSRPVGLRLDPDHKLLMWRPQYGPRPGEDGSSLPLPPTLVRAVVGSYRFVGLEKNVEVFERDGKLYVQPQGSAPVRLLHQREGIFSVDAPGGMVAEFDMSTTPAPSFVSIEGGGRERYVALRVGADDRGK